MRLSPDRSVAIMRRSSLLFLCAVLPLLCGGDGKVNGQESSDFRVVVSMVQLNVAVTDKNGNYITGLHPEDFVITEDGISEKMATFAEGSAPARSVGGAEVPAAQAAEVGGDGTLSSL